MLKQNGLLIYQGPTRWLGAASGVHRQQWDRNLRNKVGGAGILAADKASVGAGNTHPSALVLAFKPGALFTINEAVGIATATGTVIDGRNLAGTSDGVASVTGTAQLVVSGTASSDGVATVSGNLFAALNGVASSAGVATTSGAVTGPAFMVASSAGVGSGALTPYATGALAGTIAPAVTLEAASFSSYLLDTENVEAGLTLRKALRLVAAATAGKISGASGTTITIRNPVADDKDRIVATVDTNGNRTALTYDLT